MPGHNPLRRYFRQHEGPRIHKWIHYFDVYHRHFARFRDHRVTFLEFGVNQGGSLGMWQHYLHDESRIVGVDIDPRCRQFAGGNVTVEIGDQEDREFLRRLASTHGPFDVVVEDGGHTMGQQLATFEEIYPCMTDDGTFLVEDVHTSYWPNYGGGYQRPTTFMEHAKGLTDRLNAWHSVDEALVVDDFTLSTDSVHFYDSIVVFERRRRTPPVARRRGYTSFSIHDGQGPAERRGGSTGATQGSAGGTGSPTGHGEDVSP